jgi:hypothetical protein
MQASLEEVMLACRRALSSDYSADLDLLVGSSHQEPALITTHPGTAYLRRAPIPLSPCKPVGPAQFDSLLLHYYRQGRPEWTSS